jgi:hypothetical protein
MTTAGLSGLLIAGTELNFRREAIRPSGIADKCGIYEENPYTRRAIDWLSRQISLTNKGREASWIDRSKSVYYNLYGIERAGRLTGLRFFGGRDWYREGCTYLVDRQKPDGSWSADTEFDRWPPVSTSFALLFLVRGRTPILINKLVHGPGDDWNNDHHDARDLVDFAAHELFKRQPMAWQIFDAKRGVV